MELGLKRISHPLDFSTVWTFASLSEVKKSNTVNLSSTPHLVRILEFWTLGLTFVLIRLIDI